MVPQCRFGSRRPAQPCHLLCCEAGGGGEVTPLYRQGGGMLAGAAPASVPRARKAGGGAGPRAQQTEQAPYTYSQY